MYYYALLRLRELVRLQIVLKRIWCWRDGCLLSWLQRPGNVVPAWIVVIAHWTTVSISTASRLSRRLCRRLRLLYCPGVIPACFRQGLAHGVLTPIHINSQLDQWSHAVTLASSLYLDTGAISRSFIISAQTGGATPLPWPPYI